MRPSHHILKRFVVTGSSSGIGQALRLRYEESPELFGGELIFDLEDWRLGSELRSKFDNCLIIHLAHDRIVSFFENITAIEKLFKNIRPGSILLSSISAHSQSKSNYGKSISFESSNDISISFTDGNIFPKNSFLAGLELVVVPDTS